MKKAISIIILVLVIIGFTSTSQEVRDRAFIQSIAIQSDSNHVYTTVKLYGDSYVYKGIGSDIETSLKSAETRQGKVFFSGHTEMIIFQEDSFSNDILKDIIKYEEVSPNCAVVISNSEVTDTQTAYSILETYDRLGEVTISTASNIIKELNSNKVVQVPYINQDFTYSTIDIG
ncbi:MAG: hypothetical protein LIO71_01470 [Ruminococcus sp.]|nr:hypothetical protein [Ruminococcus sp.]MCD7799992.1 hypothetical protein [Ruminococcus sp.]